MEICSPTSLAAKAEGIGVFCPQLHVCGQCETPPVSSTGCSELKHHGEFGGTHPLPSWSQVTATPEHLHWLSQGSPSFCCIQLPLPLFPLPFLAASSGSRAALSVPGSPETPLESLWCLSMGKHRSITPWLFPVLVGEI